MVWLRSSEISALNPSLSLDSRVLHRTVHDLLVHGIPIKAFAGPIRLGRHDADDGMREAMIYGGIGLLARLHRLQPIHEVADVVIVRAIRVGSRRARNLQYLGPVCRREGFLHLAVLTRPHHFDAQLGVLKVTRSNHHSVDVLAGQHLFCVFVALRLEVECSPYLGRPMLSRECPEITDRNRLDRHLLSRELGHADMTLTAVSAAKLPQADAIVGSKDAPIRMCAHPRQHY
jgi:hypothetical protein